MKARKVLYWALWPVGIAVSIIESLAKVVWMLIIVSNPLFLAIYLLSRRNKQERTEGEQ